MLILYPAGTPDPIWKENKTKTHVNLPHTNGRNIHRCTKRMLHSRKNGNKMELDHFQQSQFSLTLITLSKVVIVSVCPQIVSTIRTNSQLFCFRHTICVFCTHLSAACVFFMSDGTRVRMSWLIRWVLMKSRKQKSDWIHSNILYACVYVVLRLCQSQINLQVVKNGRGQQIIII